jgi:hypothetical protein
MDDTKSTLYGSRWIGEDIRLYGCCSSISAAIVLSKGAEPGHLAVLDAGGMLVSERRADSWACVWLTDGGQQSTGRCATTPFPLRVGLLQLERLVAAVRLCPDAVEEDIAHKSRTRRCLCSVPCRRLLVSSGLVWFLWCWLPYPPTHSVRPTLSQTWRLRCFAVDCCSL